MAGGLDDFKKAQLKNALRQTGGNRTLAADRLNISVRTIRNWVKKYSLAEEFPPVRGRKAL
jgi:transcriptional regulator with PAS, ATPase and Fis domain